MTGAATGGGAGPGIDDILAEVAEVEGVLAAALVEASSGMVLASLQLSDAPDPAVLAAGAADLVLLLGDLVARTGFDDDLEDVMVTVTGRHHVLRMLRGPTPEPVALIVTLVRAESNLGMARRELREIGARFDG